LRITETSWGMPLQLWVQVARLGLRIKEVAVPRVYLDPRRAFGGVLNDAAERLAYYRRVIVDAERDVLEDAPRQLEAEAGSSCLDLWPCGEACW
jgi:dolichol-phosphate mannosyltransferase